MLGEWNLKSKGQARQFLTKTDVFVPDVVEGRVRINDAGLSHLSPGRVHFKDGEVVEADCILFNTGYRITFPFLAGIEVGHIRRLFRHMILPEGPTGLCFIGFSRPAVGGIPACSEMQSRVFARICSGRLRLPDSADLRRLTDDENQREARRFSRSPRIDTLVPYVQYLDAMACLIGCHPLAEPVEERDPALFDLLWYGSLVPAQHRLLGPGALRAEALRLIRSLADPWGEARKQEYAQRVARRRAASTDRYAMENVYDNSSLYALNPDQPRVATDRAPAASTAFGPDQMAALRPPKWWASATSRQTEE